MKNEGMDFQIKVISPKEAERMLQTSGGNRPIRRQVVEQYAGAMRRGEWRLTHQGIAFDARGALRDGHHRLHAIIKAGCEVQMVVTSGLAGDAVMGMDRGAARSIADLLAWDREVADAVRFVTCIVIGNNKPTADLVMRVGQTGLAQSVERVLGASKTRRKVFATAPFRAAGGIVIMRGGDADYVGAQYRALVNAHFEEMSHVSKLLMRQVSNGSIDTKNQREIFTRAMRVFTDTRADLQKLTVTAGEVDEAVAICKSTCRVAVEEAHAIPEFAIAPWLRQAN